MIKYLVTTKESNGDFMKKYIFGILIISLELIVLSFAVYVGKIG